MKKRWARYLALFLVVVFLGGVLLRTSQNVQRAENSLHAIQVRMKSEQEAIYVLQAEWSYLNRPDRLEELALKYLDLRLPGADGVIDGVDVIPEYVSNYSDVFKKTKAQDVVFSVSPALVRKPIVSSVVRVRPGLKPRRQPVRINDNFGDLLGRLNKEDMQ